MAPCNCIIGRTSDYEGDTVYNLLDLGSFGYIEELFKFCPLCGEPITVTEQEIKQAYDATPRTVMGHSLAQTIVTRQALKMLNDVSVGRFNSKNVAPQPLISTINIRLPNRYTCTGGK